MRSGKASSRIAAFMAAVLLAGILSGCGNKTQPSDNPVEGKGRYVETQLPLPEGISTNEVFQIYKSQGSIHILTSQDNAGIMDVKDWKYSDGGFQEVTADWMKQLQIPYSEYWKGQLLLDDKGSTYFYAAYGEEGIEGLKGHLWNIADGASLADVTPEGWKSPNEEYGYYENPEDMALLENGMLVAMYYSRQEIYKSDGSLVRVSDFTNMYNTQMATWKDQIYRVQDNGMGGSSAIDVFNWEKDDPVKSIPVDQKSSGYSYISVLEDGTVILCNSDGFFRCGPEAGEWEKFMEGVDTSMALTNMWCKGVETLEDGSVYVVYGGENGSGSLMQYAFDPEAVIKELQTVELFTVGQSFLLQQAAVLFHKKHPDIIINVNTATTFEEQYDGTADYNQIFQDLNTKLLAGKGPDILVMDGLNMESFTEKGLLADINDVISPMEDNGELLSNITGDYKQEDGKRFVVPLQFSMVLAVGRDIDVESMKDIASMADVLSKTQESLMGTHTAEELVDKFLPYFADELVNGKELNKEATKKNLEYLKAIGTNCGFLEKRGEEERATSIWELASQSKLALYENNGFNGSMLPLSMAKLIKGSYTAFGDAYYPLYQIGINASSDKLDIAKEFLSFALSTEVQNEDYYQGFPVNKKSLEYQSKLDRSNAEASTAIEVGEGAYEEFTISAFDQADADKLLEACGNLNKRAIKDDKIREEIILALPGFMNGTQSLDETVNKIEGGLKMYLAE